MSDKSETIGSGGPPEEQGVPAMTPSQPILEEGEENLGDGQTAFEKKIRDIEISLFFAFERFGINTGDRGGIVPFYAVIFARRSIRRKLHDLNRLVFAN